MMKNSEAAELEYDLSSGGHRMTRLRKTLIDVFTLRRQPLSTQDLLEILKKRGLTPHKVTLYRELDFLKAKKIIVPVDMTDGLQRFEFIYREHHHHAVCTQCHTIRDIELESEDVYMKKMLKTPKSFKIVSHAIEFFGVCGQCNNV